MQLWENNLKEEFSFQVAGAHLGVCAEYDFCEWSVFRI